MTEGRQNALLALTPIGVSSALGAGAFLLGSGEMGVGAMAIASGLGAAMSIAALPLVAVGIVAVAVAAEENLAEIIRAADEVSPLLSPGTLLLTPISPLFSPADQPLLFAKVYGADIDLGIGLSAEGITDRSVALVQSSFNLRSWYRCDRISNLESACYLTGQRDTEAEFAFGPDGNKSRLWVIKPCLACQLQELET